MKTSLGVNIILRIAGIVFTSFLLIFIFAKGYYISGIFLAAILVLQISLLLRMVNSANRQMAMFIESLSSGSFTGAFVGNTAPLFKQFDESLKQAQKRFHNILYKKEEEYQYLQAILQNIDIGIIVYDRDGKIQMINRAASKFFKISKQQNLSDFDTSVAQTLLELKAGNTCLLTLSDDDDEILYLSVSGIEFHTKDKSLMLVSVKNIYSVLEEKETEAWQKLISVLTHEIMNSITPIASLAETVAQTIQTNKSENNINLNPQIIAETEQALQTINRRSTGLLRFVEQYRSLTHVPLPKHQLVNIKNLINSVVQLFDDDFKQKQIKLNTHIPQQLQLLIDPQLIEQVLINLLKNASEAFVDKVDAEVSIRVFYNTRNHPCIEIADNGQGILPEVLDKIFIPFFTTKTKGSGIGLSLSRQIMHKHQGKIIARSQYGKGSVFTLQF